MGQASRKRQMLQSNLETLQAAASAVSHTVRRLTEAASANLGSDCFLVAKLGQVLLADQGIKAEITVGHAAWRVGPGDSDVIAHTPAVPGYVPPGVKGMAYHAWLVLPDYGVLLDFTTCQLRLKAQQLDELDGGTTLVDWCPDFLLAPVQASKSYSEVARAAAPVAFHYNAQPAMLSLLDSTYALDASDVQAARLLMKNPDAQVMGPNSML